MPDDLKEVEPGDVAATVQGVTAKQVEEWQETLDGEAPRRGLSGFLFFWPSGR